MASWYMCWGSSGGRAGAHGPEDSLSSWVLSAWDSSTYVFVAPALLVSTAEGDDVEHVTETWENEVLIRK